MGTHDLWLEGRLHLAVLDLGPVDPPEEGVGLDLLLAVGGAAQPLLRLLRQELWKGCRAEMGHDGVQIKSNVCKLDPITSTETKFI